MSPGQPPPEQGVAPVLAGPGDRLDKLVAHAAGVSRRVARTWIAGGKVTVDGRVVRILTRPLKPGAKVAWSVAENAQAVRPPQAPRPERRLDVLFKDKYLVVVDKPAGLLSERDRFGSPSLEDLVPQWLEAAGEHKTGVWLVHRLDAGTSGVIVLARTKQATEGLSQAFREAEVEKHYLAIVKGRLEGPRTIDMPIARLERTRHGPQKDGKPALTHVEPLAQAPGATLVLARPKTGRTHQIRVHLSAIGLPLFGDRLYGGPMYRDDGEPVPRPMLHAHRLRFAHPKTSEPQSFVADPPADFLELLARLGLGWAPASPREGDDA